MVYWPQGINTIAGPPLRFVVGRDSGFDIVVGGPAIVFLAGIIRACGIGQGRTSSVGMSWRRIVNWRVE